jgi:hypothetical protein
MNQSNAAHRSKSSYKGDLNRSVIYRNWYYSRKQTTAFVYMDGSDLAVDLKAVAEETEITLFDVSGKLLLRKDLDGLAVHKLKVNATTQILLVHLRNEKGVLNTKVIYAVTR